MPKRWVLISACALAAFQCLGGSVASEARFTYGKLQCVSLTGNQRYEPKAAACFPPGGYWSFCGGNPGPGEGGGWLLSSQPCNQHPIPP
jgi:hypothetical protein